MVAKEFIDFFNSISDKNRVAIEDFADRLNLFTCVLFMLACVVISAKQYMFNAISCYIPVKPGGEDFKNFLTDYCWVHGTIPLHHNEILPSTEKAWSRYDETRRITYYQWVPFVLGLQCILFYLPHITWQTLCSRRSGGDLFSLIKSAADSAIMEREAREHQVKRVAEFLEDMIEVQKDCRKQTICRRLIHGCYESCGLCVVSKRLGTCLLFSYMMVKLVTLCNAVLQVYLIQRFLGLYPDGSSGRKSLELGNQSGQNSVVPLSGEYDYLHGFAFGVTVVRHILAGRDWPETLVFPRVAYCHVPGIRLVGVKNTYTAQCTLPVNMLNEKIYIFFWFWIMFLISACVISISTWMCRMMVASARKDFVKRFLRVKGIVSKETGEQMGRADVGDFIDNYLRRDGIFLLYMLSVNAGELVTSEITAVLYQNYAKLTAGQKPSIGRDEKLATVESEI